MAIFLDTGMFVAARNNRDTNHIRAVQLLGQSLKGEFGRVCTSDYVVDEALTTALYRTRDLRIALNVGRLALESPRIEVLYTDSGGFSDAWKRFQRRAKRPMSFTDCVSLVQMEKHDIERIASFDSEFDGFVTRIH